MDDYLKVFKKNKQGLAGRFKIIGQVALGLVVGFTMYFNDSIVIREKVVIPVVEQSNETNPTIQAENFTRKSVKSTKTTIPFFKNNEAEYSKLLGDMGEGFEKWAFLIFIPIVIFIIVAVSNGANLTDGIDGLATGTSAIIGATLGILAWVSGNIVFSDYLNIMYIPDTGELTIFISAFVGACIGFLWYNSYPAQVFMGDTGSLAIGGIIAVFAILIRKELMIPILCGIFVVESLSVIMQVSYFKYTKKRFGAGKRIFKMSPLHHHYQVMGYAEPKIVQRFIIVGIMLAVFAIITLKLR
jgi:phospho-N-acetylmuramoyl-pentapeptide-transferase